MQEMIERLCFVGVESDRIMEEISKEDFEDPNAPKYNKDDINKDGTNKDDANKQTRLLQKRSN